MEVHYKTLQTIFTITQHDTHPCTYPCRPREIILRQFQDWSIIEQHLKQLQQEGLIVIKQLDTLVINITTAGIDKVLSLNFDLQNA